MSTFLDPRSDPISTLYRPYADPTSILYRPYIDGFIDLISTIHRPYIDHISTTYRPYVGLISTIYRPYVDPTSILDRPHPNKISIFIFVYYLSISVKDIRSYLFARSAPFFFGGVYRFLLIVFFGVVSKIDCFEPFVLFQKSIVFLDLF